MDNHLYDDASHWVALSLCFLFHTDKAFVWLIVDVVHILQVENGVVLIILDAQADATVTHSAIRALDRPRLIYRPYRFFVMAGNWAKGHDYTAL